jgi:hypothetical protein
MNTQRHRSVEECHRAIPGWRLAAHVILKPPPADWRDTLAARLGRRPRRIGQWAELALYGAWRCLDAAGETTLVADARLRVTSLGGQRKAVLACLAQLRENNLLMPFDFMQSQPAMMLAALTQGLKWQGDASFLNGRDLPQLMRLALHGAKAGGLLMGQIEEEAGLPCSQWWRWLPESPATVSGQMRPDHQTPSP